MSKILVLYDSHTGNTAKMAEFVAEGAASIEGTDVRRRSIDEATAEDVLWCDGLAVGSPTNMGLVSWKMKKFWDETMGPQWMKVDGKIGCTFFVLRRLGGRRGTGLPVDPDAADEFRSSRLRRDRLRGQVDDSTLRNGHRPRAARPRLAGCLPPVGQTPGRMDRHVRGRPPGPTSAGEVGRTNGAGIRCATLRPGEPRGPCKIRITRVLTNAATGEHFPAARLTRTPSPSATGSSRGRLAQARSMARSSSARSSTSSTRRSFTASATLSTCAGEIMPGHRRRDCRIAEDVAEGQPGDAVVFLEVRARGRAVALEHGIAGKRLDPEPTHVLLLHGRPQPRLVLDHLGLGGVRREDHLDLVGVLLDQLLEVGPVVRGEADKPGPARASWPSPARRPPLRPRPPCVGRSPSTG